MYVFYVTVYITGKLFSPQTTLIDFYKVSLFGTKLGYLLRALFIAQIFKFSQLQQTCLIFGNHRKILIGFLSNNPYMFI